MKCVLASAAVLYRAVKKLAIRVQKLFSCHAYFSFSVMSIKLLEGLPVNR